MRLENSPEKIEPVKNVSLVVLGTVQDAGSPQIGCNKACCKSLWEQADNTRKVVSLGVVIPETKSTILFEATPDIDMQLHRLNQFAGLEENMMPSAIFLTHAHTGHYTGLLHLGREAINAQQVPVFAMPKMHEFLCENAPWSQLVSIQNISLQTLKADSGVLITPHVEITPIVVPHRDEFSETVGYVISGPKKSALFIPDIDKWSKWERDIVAEISKVDYAFLDATFFDGEELNNRDMSEIPHPFVVESIQLFESLSVEEKGKIYFIHFNHTNPVLNENSAQAKMVLSKGFNIATINTVFEL